MLPPLQFNTDQTFDIFYEQRQSLKAIFEPKAVAVIGASNQPNSVGRTLVWNLISSPFGGTVYPVNPKYHSVLGIQTYPNIESVPESVDLAIIATPAVIVPQMIKECVQAKVKSAIIVSAGIESEQQIRQIAQGKLRIIGTSCLGVMNPHRGLNATFAGRSASSGNLGFISQSGAICTAVLDWSIAENVGFSAFISLGSMIDVDWGDLINYLGDDPNTHSIVMCIESVGNARSFLSAAREVALSKPIVVIKIGHTEEKGVFEAACRRCGILEVKRISELFNLAEVLAKQIHLPKGPRLSIITNAFGTGVLAAEALKSDGGQLAELFPETIARLNEVLPPYWSQQNPIDILGDADPKRYAKVLEIATEDPNSDGLLVILTPQAMSDPTQTAEHLLTVAQTSKKPILASWMGGEQIAEGEAILNQNQIPTYRYPDSAARLFNWMWRYSYNLKGIYETPVLDPSNRPNRELVNEMIQSIYSKSRLVLTEIETRQILNAYGISTETEAIRLDEGYKLIISSQIDPQFGPVLRFATGGKLGEIFQDQAIALPPLNTTLARRMMEQTQIYQALKQKKFDLAPLEQLLVKFSQLVIEQPQIQIIEINPLLVSLEQITAQDTRIILYPLDTLDQRPTPAIRPYPIQYVSSWTMKDGTLVTIRPIRPEDEPLMVKFHQTLSEQSVYLRYFHLVNFKQRTTHERLTRLCFIDYDREMALVVESNRTGEPEILAVARLSKSHAFNEAEFSMLVSDRFQGQGIGTELLKRLIEIGREEKLERIKAEILIENRGMQRVAQKAGFQLHPTPDVIEAELAYK